MSQRDFCGTVLHVAQPNGFEFAAYLEERNASELISHSELAVHCKKGDVSERSLRYSLARGSARQLRVYRVFGEKVAF